jgi:DNA-binding transcriptional LysR family regulator
MNAQTIQKVQLADLIEFVTVAEHRSFVRAAAQLGVTTVTLNQTIRALEGRLGLRLLNRTTRRVAPTRVGECLLEKLRPILEDLESELEDEPDTRSFVVRRPIANHSSLPAFGMPRTTAGRGR